MSNDTASLTSEIAALKAQMEKINKENEQLKYNNTHLKNNLDHLQKLYLSQKNDLSSVGKYISDYEVRIVELEQVANNQNQTIKGMLWSLENRSKQAKEDFENFKERITRETEKVEHYKNKCLVLEKQMKKKKDVEEEGEQEERAGQSILEKLKAEAEAEAAGSSKGNSEGEKKLPMCEICVRPYDDVCPDLIPRVLSCGHTLCEECAGRVIEFGDLIQCPFDRTQTSFGSKGVLGLPKNFTVVQMIEESKKASK